MHPLKANTIEKGFLEVHGLQIYSWRSQNSGSPIFLLHGMAVSSYTWRYIIPSLAERFTVIAPDWPGHGRSDKPLDFEYSVAGYHRFLLALMDRLGIRRASLVGNSMGGLVSLLSAIESPDRVDRLVLLGTPAYPKSKPFGFNVFQLPLLGTLAQQCLGPWFIPIMARHLFYDAKIITKELIAEYGLTLGPRAGRTAIGQIARSINGLKVEEYLHRYKTIQQKTLIISGEQDPLSKPKEAQRLSQDLPNAELMILPSCGHGPQEEKPEVVTQALLRFLVTT